MHALQPVQVIDSHTGGEPTRLVISGGPELGQGPLSERRQRLQQDYDDFRAAVVNEPRGADVWVGALLCAPSKDDYAAGVIFFNNVGYLGMCGHGTMGLLVSLHHAQRLSLGEHQIETPVGSISATLHDAHRVSVRNVPSYRYRRQQPLMVEGLGMIHGDIAWGGNWFFIVADHQQQLLASHIPQLTEVSSRIRAALERHQVRAADGAVIDHIELVADSPTPGINARNFVLCPGLAYDRSPCGTGTSAKLACLYADGLLQPGDIWRQESIIGSVFEGRLLELNNHLIPEITGTAYVTATATLLFDPADPFRHGLITHTHP